VTGHPALFDRACRITPGGVHSPVRAFRSVGGAPVFFERGDGAQLFDVDGRRYIDLCMSFGPLILGHADLDTRAAAHAAIDDGWSFGACEPYSLALAEWMSARLPWLERVRFVSSGTEAVMSALRIARAATGRDRILKFEGCYHGHADAMLVKAGSGLAGAAAASSDGITASALGNTLVAPLDDDAALDRVFEANGSSIAAAIIEPLPANYGLLPQRADWIRRLVERCHRAGALVIFDEVISGFRIGLTGMAGELGLSPDLVTYGKVIGGGFPVGAYGGRADLMDKVAPLGGVYQAGTLSANPVGMRVGLATLEKAERVDVWRVLEDRTAQFAAVLSGGFARVSGGPEVVRRGSLLWFRRPAPAPVRRIDDLAPDQSEWYARFFHAALKRGVYLPPAAFEVSFTSLAHDADVLDEAATVLIDAGREAAGT
jgi:glutamate-1-semialdehyde 2,1-aminomutase